MVRGLAPATAAISLSCCHGRSSAGRSCPSPASSQATTIAVRAERAAATAAARAAFLFGVGGDPGKTQPHRPVWSRSRLDRDRVRPSRPQSTSASRWPAHRRSATGWRHRRSCRQGPRPRSHPSGGARSRRLAMVLRDPRRPDRPARPGRSGPTAAPSGRRSIAIRNWPGRRGRWSGAESRSARARRRVPRTPSRSMPTE